jgi:hypothetical protein
VPACRVAGGCGSPSRPLPARAERGQGARRATRGATSGWARCSCTRSRTTPSPRPASTSPEAPARCCATTAPSTSSSPTRTTRRARRSARAATSSGLQEGHVGGGFQRNRRRRRRASRASRRRERPFLGQWYDAESGLHYNHFQVLRPRARPLSLPGSERTHGRPEPFTPPWPIRTRGTTGTG